MPKDKLLEAREYTGEGYSPVVDYGAWRGGSLDCFGGLLGQELPPVEGHDGNYRVVCLYRGRWCIFLG